MKKSIFMSLLAAVSLGMATVSCSSDNTEDGQGGSGSGKMETYTISCSFDKDTRMMLDANATPRQYKWENNDQITVWNASGNKIATGVLTEGAGTKDGKFKFASSETAKYVTFVSGGTGGSVTAEGKQITIDPVQTYASTGTDISGLPIMAQGELTEVTGKKHEYTTTLQHKMSFLKFGTITYGGAATDLAISGTKTATINPTSGTVTSDATYTNSTIAAANVTSGKMIAVFPGCNFAAAVHRYYILNNPTIAANLIYPVSNRIFYTVTVAAGTGGTASISAGAGATLDTDNNITVFTTSNSATFTATATPSSGYAFDGWYDGTTSVSTSATLTAAVYDYRGKTLTAKFKTTVREITINDFYQWDAYSHFVDGTRTFGPGLEGYNSSNTPSHSCASATNAAQAYGYVQAGMYYDDGTIGDASTGKQFYKLPDGNTYSNGVWVKKNAAPVTIPSNNNVYDKYHLALTATNAASIRTSGDYFFLPMAGYYYHTPATYAGNNFGMYWTSTYVVKNGAESTPMAWVLLLTKTKSQLALWERWTGALPSWSWQ